MRDSGAAFKYEISAYLRSKGLNIEVSMHRNGLRTYGPVPDRLNTTMAMLDSGSAAVKGAHHLPPGAYQDLLRRVAEEY